ncbi:MAG: proP 3 [Gammaproteobacteria bacterium]|nr:proP 3 [Gammaproteobacteria bacterium]
MLNKAQRQLLFLSSLGGILEFYDFIIYALFAAYIAANFFPLQDKLSSLIATFTTFSIGYLARPLGGIFFGHFGDRIGRKKTFTVSILLMAVTTFAVALIPTYQQIGILAPLILTFLRILQGIALGGEIPGAIAYVSESLPEKKGLGCGFIFFAVNSGTVLALLTQATLQSILSSEQLFSWGWRIPFIVGGIFGYISYQLRQQLEESRIFQSIEHKIERFPLIKVFKKESYNMAAAICIAGIAASTIGLLFLFIPSYFNNVLNIHNREYTWYSALTTFLVALLCILMGWLSDKFNRKFLFIVSALFLIVISYPVFQIYVNHFEQFKWALLLSLLAAGSTIGTMPGLLAESFPTAIRYSGIAASYNIGFALFGGLMPLISLILVNKTGLLTAPAFCLIFSAILAIPATIMVKQRHIHL